MPHPRPTVDEATRAYVYGYPLVYDLREVEASVSGHSSLPVSAPYNQFATARDLLGPETKFVTPNNDTLIEQLTRQGGDATGWRSAAHLFDYNLDALGPGTIDSPVWKIADRTTAYATRALAAMPMSSDSPRRRRSGRSGRCRCTTCRTTTSFPTPSTATRSAAQRQSLASPTMARSRSQCRPTNRRRTGERTGFPHPREHFVPSCGCTCPMTRSSRGATRCRPSPASSQAPDPRSAVDRRGAWPGEW